MASLGTLGIGVNLDLTQLEGSLTQLNRATRLVDSSMRATSSSFGRTEKDSKKLGTQLEGLTKKHEIQTKKVEIQRKKYEELVKTKGEDSAATQNAAIELNKSVDVLNKYETEIEGVTREMKEMEAESKRLKKENSALSRSFGNVDKELTKLADGMERVGQGMKDLGRGMTTRMTLPIVGGLAASTKAAIDWESAFAGVKKTVDGSDALYGELTDELRGMAMELPETAVGLAGIAEMAGQLGIDPKNIASFTRTIVDLGESTNMTTEQAATEFARFGNIMGMSQNDVDRLGSTIVGLGNNYATTESEIMAMGMRLAGVGKTTGMTETQVMALATMMSSLGVEAESGGTAMTTVMKKMQNAVASGGQDLEAFASGAGVSTQQFADAFNRDPMEALTLFLQGLEATADAGGNLNAVLDSVGVKGIRESDSILRLVGNSEVLTEALDLASVSWDENNALTKEAEERYKTMASQLSILKNNFIELGIQIGDRILPYLTILVDKSKEVVKWFTDLDEGTKDIIIVFSGIVAAIGPLLMGLGLFMGLASRALRPIAALFGVLSTVGVAGTLGMIGKAMLRFLGPLGLLVGGFILAKDKLDDWGLDFKGAMELIKGTLEGMKEIFEGNTFKGEKILEDLGFKQETIDKLSDFTSNLKIEYEKLKIRFGAVKDLLTGEGDETTDRVFRAMGFPPNMTEKFEEFQADLDIFKEKVKIYFRTFFDVVTGDMDSSTKGVLKSLGFSDELIDALDNIFSRIRGLVSSGVDIIKGLITGDGEGVKKALEGFGITPEMLTTIQEVFGGAGDVIEKVYDTIWSLASLIGGEVGIIMEEIIVYISDLFTRFSEFWNEHGEDVIKVLEVLMKVVGPMMMVIVGALKLALQTVFFVIKLLLENVKGVLDGFFSMIGGAIKLFAGIFTGDFSKMWEGVKDIFFGFIEFIWNGFQLLFVGRLVSAATKGIKALLGFFSGFRTQGEGIFRGIWNIITTIWNYLVNGLVTRASGMVKTVVDFFKNLRADGVGIFRAIWQTITQIFTTLKNNISTTARTIWENVKKPFIWLKDSVVNTIQTMKDKALEWFVKLKTDATGTAKNTVKEVVDFFKELPGKIGKGLSSMSGKMWEGIKELGNKLGLNLAKVVNSIIAGINGLTTSIGIEYNVPDLPAPEFSKGTKKAGGHAGGLMTVGDHGPGNSGLGKTRELVRTPDGRVGLFDKETTLNAPKGTEVYSNKDTEKILKASRYSTGTPGGGLGDLYGRGMDFVKNIGSGLVDVWEALSDPKEIINTMASGLLDTVTGSMTGFSKNLTKGLFGKVKDGALNYLIKSKEKATPEFNLNKLLSGHRINYGYGKYPFDFNGGNHYGIDTDHVYDPVRAAMGGKVLRNFYDSYGGGNTIEIQSGKVYQWYAHMSKSLVKAGDMIKAGQKIGISGNTGANTTGPHLHFQLFKNLANPNGSSFDPVGFLNKQNKGNGGGSGPFNFWTGGIIEDEGYYNLGERGPEAIVPLDRASENTAAMVLRYLNERIGNKGRNNKRPSNLKVGGNVRDDGFHMMVEQNEILKKQLEIQQRQIELKEEEMRLQRDMMERGYTFEVDGRTAARALRPHLKKQEEIEGSRDRRFGKR